MNLDLLGGASLRVVDLAAPLTALVGPWEVSNWDDEEGVAAVGDTGKGVVPGGKGSDDTKGTTGSDAAGVLAVEVSDTEHQEGEVQSEEEEEESDGGAESADEEEEGEDEPSLEHN